MNSSSPYIRRFLRLLWGRNPRRTLLRAGILAAVLLLLFSQVLRPTWTRGVSMEPNIQDGSFRFINYLAYRNRDPRRGDIVVIPMRGKRSYYLKRVLGEPGETLGFSNGQLMINGQVMPEPWKPSEGNWSLPPQAIPPGEYFIAGDNRAVPIEQHLIGRVKRKQITGGLLY